jgi:SNF2 family DNA or RNA helicase
MQSLLNGSTVDLQTPLGWPGLCRLIDVPSQAVLDELSLIPGCFQYQGNTYKKIPPGFYIPLNLLYSDYFPDRINQQPLENNMTTPYNGRVLREHQAQAVSYIRAHTPQLEGCILGAEMGLGKCTTSLQALHLDGLLSQPGVVCGPLPCKSAWVGESTDAKLYYNLDICALSGRKEIDPTQLMRSKHIFVHYDILDSWYVWISKALEPRWIIFDEIHYLQNSLAARSKAAANLSRWHTVQRRIGLSGTPFTKRRIDLWHLLRCVQPRQWGDSFYPFGIRYCGGKRGRAAGDETAEAVFYEFLEDTHTEELCGRLSSALLWYSKAEVTTGLPKINRVLHEIQLEDKALTQYTAAAQDIRKFLKEDEQDNVPAYIEFNGVKVKGHSRYTESALRLKALSTLFDILSEYKAKIAYKYILNLHKHHDKIVIFTWLRKTAEYITDVLRENVANISADSKAHPRVPVIIGPVHGKIKQPNREKEAKRFEKEPIAIFVATIESVGIAINELAAGTACLFLDLHWSPYKLAQAESRIDRDSKYQHTEAEAHYMICKGTIDELYIKHVIEKAEAAQAIKQNDSMIDLASALSGARVISVAELVAKILQED